MKNKSLRAPVDLICIGDELYASLDGRLVLKRERDGWAVWDFLPGRAVLTGVERAPTRVGWRLGLEAALACLAAYAEILGEGRS